MRPNETKRNETKANRASSKGKTTRTGIEIGYAWRLTLGDSASLSGVFAGFAIAFIVLILGLTVTKCPIPYVSIVSWGDIGVLLMGIAVGLFISASQFFVQAKACDMRSIPNELAKFIEADLSKDKIAFADAASQNDKHARYYESRGRHCYNIGVLFMLLGLGLSIIPYNWIIGLCVLVACVLPEAYQYHIIPT